MVTGTVVLSIGLSLISVGINSFGGGNKAKDFGSVENLLLALFVLVVILFFKHWTTGFLSSSAILIGILAGYVVLSSNTTLTGISLGTANQEACATLLQLSTHALVNSTPSCRRPFWAVLPL